MINTDDTIVAISTAAGDAARAIVRLSGPAAVALASRVFSRDEGVSPSCLAGILPASGEGDCASSSGHGNGMHNAGETPASRCGPLEALGGFRRVEGIVAWDSMAFPAAAYVFRGPRSFTRQDVVELHVPGSSVVAVGLQGALVLAGARLAAAGEFTARAFFSGRLDLSAAEAVADVIDAADDAQLRCATSALGGRVARLCAAAAGETADALALVEASIDFAEEGIELASPESVSAALEATAHRVDELARAAADMPETFAAPRVVMCGYPNAGKSSLLNALAGCDRAIVSPLAGTTRDVLSAEIVLPGTGCVTLQDAAGFAAAGDAISHAANEAAHAAVRAADVVLLVTDLAAPDETPASRDALRQRVQHANPRARVLWVENKIDLAPRSDGGCASSCSQPNGTHNVGEAPASRETLAPRGSNESSAIRTSAVTGEGVDALRRALANLLATAAARSGQALGLHARQRQSFLAAVEAIAAAASLLASCHTLADKAELVAVDLRHALASLGQVSGQAVTEDVLGRIFSRFCVGK
ncbi:MAG: 50S ribosome-binding GTPase [Phycisphaerae bacterium]|nr:50S ribosome-binding GTPase [Phycisphaerae bacterium]